MQRKVKKTPDTIKLHDTVGYSFISRRRLLMRKSVEWDDHSEKGNRYTSSKKL